MDGFKRLRASRRLKKPSLLVRTLDLTVRACKAAMIRLNDTSPSLHAMEEAWVLRSLYREDGLTQEQIGVLVGRDKSWVSRRLLLVEELDEDVQQDVRLGSCRWWRAGKWRGCRAATRRRPWRRSSSTGSRPGK